MIKSLLTEYGIAWAVNRSLYSAKLRLMSVVPGSEKLFEKNIHVKRIDIFSFDIKAIKCFLLNLSAEKKNEIITIADKAINGEITGFSSIELDYGNPINWHYSPFTKVECDKDVKWFRIPDFEKVRGDIKVIWEASRFTHFFYLIRAYLITDDHKYYTAFSEQLEQWLTSNPYSFGANYKCGQECTLRMINTLIAFTVFKSSGVAAAKDEQNVTNLVEASYKKVLSNFFYAHKCIKNNHTISEICGLIIGAWCCENEAGVKKAYKLFDREIESQFFADGGYSQYSFNYQRFTLQIIECIIKIKEKTGFDIGHRERIKKSLLLLNQVQAENGDIPNYGSNDGALIFPVTACDYRDFRPVINTVHVLLEGKRFFYEHGDYDEELLWFGDGREIPVIPLEKKVLTFNESGFYTLSHNDGFLMACLQKFKTRPSHMDQLHIDLWHKGVNIFCDTGTYSYASELGKELASTAGHNTVKFSGVEQMNKRGTFLLCDWTARRNVKFGSDSFSGTMVSRNGYEHTRTITKKEKGYLIDDEVRGNGEYCEFYFHTPCDIRLIPNGFELLEKGAVICIVGVKNGDISVKRTYRSLYYLQKEEINCVIVKCRIENRKCRTQFEIGLIS